MSDNNDQPSIGGAATIIVPIVIAWMLADTARPYGQIRDYWVGILIGIGCTNLVRFVFEVIRANTGQIEMCTCMRPATEPEAECARCDSLDSHNGEKK